MGLLHRMLGLAWQEETGPSSQSRRHCLAAGGTGRALQDKDRPIRLLSQEMGEAQLEVITQTFCAVEETSSDSAKLLASCCELGVSGLPRNGQERKGWLSLGGPRSMKTPAQGLPGHSKCPEEGGRLGSGHVSKGGGMKRSAGVPHAGAGQFYVLGGHCAKCRVYQMAQVGLSLQVTISGGS